MTSAQETYLAQPDHQDERYEQHELRELSARISPQAAEASLPENIDSPTAVTPFNKASRRGRGTLPDFPGLLHVPLSSARDHLANERVFLAYIRTSAAIANFAVVILQLYRLKHSPPPAGKLSDYDIGVPLSAVTLVIAMVVALVGAVRFFLCQTAMTEMRVLGSGLMVVTFTVVGTLLLLTILIFTIIINPNV